jgi:AraC-like DNA-binding protein
VRVASLPGRGRLEPFIEQIWYLEDSAATPGAPPTLIFPDGRMEIVLQIGAPMRQQLGADSCVQPRAMLVGYTVDTVSLTPTGPIATLGVSFKPAGASAWLRWRQHEMTGRFAALDAVWPALARRVADRVAAARDDHDRFDAVERALLALLPDDAAADPAVAATVTQLRRTGGRASIEAIGRQTGISRRQLERRFGDAVGLSPRLYGRIVRFQHVLRHVGRVSGADLAARCGYADQAHLIREVRRFTGHTPGALEAIEQPMTEFFARV